MTDETPKPSCPNCGGTQIDEHCPKKSWCWWLFCKSCRRAFDPRKQAAG